MLQHDIKVRGATPVKQHAYRVNPTKRGIMSREVAYHGFAFPSCSPWSSPCILIPKHITSRFCRDYRKVNALTGTDSFPMLRIDNCVDHIRAASFESKLDLLKGYSQIPLTPRASDISVFVTSDQFAQFDMRNPPAAYQRLISVLLAGV